MTDIREKALALVNELFAESGGSPIDYAALFGAGDIVTLALCRAIEQHEAFKQKMSDAVESALLDAEDGATIRNNLGHFIIPKPKPDPLVEVLDYVEWPDKYALGKDISDALDALGFEIREKGQ
jgi:hypothetical protein